MRKKTWLLLFVVLIIATFFRTYHLKTVPPGLYPDEAMNGSNAQEALETGNFKVFYPENNGREGLFMNIQAVFLKVIGKNEPWVLRLPSAIFGILTVLGLFFLVRELFKSDGAGLAASFFLAVSFWHVNFSRIGFRAITAPFFLIWAVYFFLTSIRRNSFWRAGIAGAFFGLGFYSYIAYRIMPLLFLLFIPFFRKAPGFWKLCGVFVAATFIVALPIGWYYLGHPADFMGRTTQVSVFGSANPVKELVLNTAKTIGMLNVHGDWNWRHNYAGRPELFWFTGFFFWAGIALAVYGFKKELQYKFQYLLLFSWLALSMLPVITSAEGIPHALRSILMIPPIFAFAGWGAYRFYDKLAPRLNPQAKALVMGFVVAAMIAPAYKGYFKDWANDPNTAGAFAADYAAIAKEINALPPSQPKYVVVEAGGVAVTVQTPDGKKDIPMPAQTVMFMTASFTAKGQLAKSIHYVLPAETGSIPQNAKVFYIR